MAIIGFVALVAFSGFEATFALLAERRFSLTEGGVAAVFVGIGLLLTVVQGGLIGPDHRPHRCSPARYGPGSL